MRSVYCQSVGNYLNYDISKLDVLGMVVLTGNSSTEEEELRQGNCHKIEASLVFRVKPWPKDKQNRHENKSKIEHCRAGQPSGQNEFQEKD